MTNGIYLIGRGKVNEGRIDTAKATLGGLISNVRKNNPGVEFYEHAVDPKTGAWTGLEKYKDSEALKAHLKDPAVGEALGKFMAELDFEGLVMIGEVSKEVREMMASFNPTYLGSSIGFARSAGQEVVSRNS